jgi:steroid delta-isomerase-like uncharacterized protein
MKRSLLLLPFFLFIIFSCQNKETQAKLDEVNTKTELEEQNLALLGKYIEAWNTFDTQVFDDLLDSQFKIYVPSNSENPMSLEQHKEWIDGIFQAYPDIHYDIQDIFAYKDKVCLRWTCTATYLGDDPDNPATGKQILGSAIEIYTVENGKITEERSEMDALGWNLQLGFELKMKE